MSAAEHDTPLGRATREVETVNRTAGAAERFKVGILTPLTEPGAMLAGEMLVRGACLGVEYVRERGEAFGKPVELVLANDQASASYEPMWRSAVGEMAKLAIFGGVGAVLGQWMVRTTSWTVELSHRLGIVHFVTTGHPEVTARGYRTVFRTFYTTTERAELMVRFMKERGARRLAILASTSPFGKFYADAAQRFASAGPNGCEVLRFDFDPDTAKDFRRELGQIKEWKPDFFLNLGIIARDSCYHIVNQAGEIGLCPEVPMLMGIPAPSASADFWKRVGANGELVVWPATQFRPGWSGLTPVGHWFIARYTAKYGGFPSEMSLTAFTDVTIIAQALARARAQTSEGLVDSLESGAFESWRGPISFERRADHWHHSSPTVQLMQYQSVGQALEQAAIVYPPQLKTHEFGTRELAPAEART